MSWMSSVELEREEEGLVSRTRLEDLAYFISRFDEARDVYEQLGWVEKILGRLTPEEASSISIPDLRDFHKYAELARCFANAQRIEHDDHSVSYIFPLPGYAKGYQYRFISESEIPRLDPKDPEAVYHIGKEWIRYGEGEHAAVCEVEWPAVWASVSEALFCVRLPRAVSLWPSPSSFGHWMGWRGWSYRHMVHREVPCSSIRLNAGEFTALKAEFEGVLSRYLGGIAREVRLRFLEGVPIHRRRREAEEKEDEQGR